MSVAMEAAGPEHAAALARLHANGFERGWPEADFAGALAREGVSGWLAREAGAPAGFILCQAVMEEAEILTLTVAPHMRRRGIGAALIAAAAAGLKARGAERLLLEVSEANVPARALYERAGFAVDGRRRGYYATPEGAKDAILMSLRL